MKNHAFFVLFAIGAFDATVGFAGVSSLNTSTAIRPVSQYGLIQNVQDYSTNPFWNKNTPYNLNFPQPVYVTGPELNTADCQSTVSALVSSFCIANDNCMDMRLADIRPVIMLQLARMPGHNYASNCSGFIDSEFDSYVKQYSNTLPNGTVKFPGATEANPNYNAPEFKLENPYIRRDGTWQGEEWQKEKNERKQELKDLQSLNGAGGEKLAKTAFPTTFADLSFTERMDIKGEGYEPYTGKSAYNPIQIEKEDEYLSRLQNANRNAYCNRYPSSTVCNENSGVIGNNEPGNNPGLNTPGGGTVNDGIIHLVLR